MMKLQSDPNQQYQIDAVAAVTDRILKTLDASKGNASVEELKQIEGVGLAKGGRGSGLAITHFMEQDRDVIKQEATTKRGRFTFG